MASSFLILWPGRLIAIASCSAPAKDTKPILTEEPMAFGAATQLKENPSA
jgi:hypothetical protein